MRQYLQLDVEGRDVKTMGFGRDIAVTVDGCPVGMLYETLRGRWIAKYGLRHGDGVYLQAPTWDDNFATQEQAARAVALYLAELGRGA